MEKSQRDKFKNYVKELNSISIEVEKSNLVIIEVDKNGFEIKNNGEKEIVEELETPKTTDDILADLIQTLIEKNII